MRPNEYDPLGQINLRTKPVRLPEGQSLSRIVSKAVGPKRTEKPQLKLEGPAAEMLEARGIVAFGGTHEQIYLRDSQGRESSMPIYDFHKAVQNFIRQQAKRAALDQVTSRIVERYPDQIFNYSQ
ncbi:hypothetical protein ACFL3C_01250 [Patescibacteria group bacterium]